MKLTAAQVERFLRSPTAPVALVYGPDEGLVRERAERLVLTALDDPKDPFRLSEVGADALRAEPALLADEARSLCLLGGRRVVRLRQATDQASAAVRALLALDAIEALVVIDAGDLGGGSSLRRLVEGAPNAAALPCYRDEGRGLAALVDRLLEERHLEVDADARAYLLEHVGADRGVTRAELDKLALYLADAPSERPRRVSLDHVAAVVGDSAALGIDDLVHAAALGQTAAVGRILDRLLGEGQSPVRLVRSLANHVARLHRMALLVERGDPPDRVIERARPPVHFRRKADLRTQLASWSAERAADALARLLEAEIACKTTGWPARLMCEQAVFATSMAVPHR